MSTNTPVFNTQESANDQKEQLRRVWFRVIPYLPVIVIAILLGGVFSFFYLRYATKTFASKARLIVNDDSQQKSSNLIEIMKLDTRNLSTETEREMEILRSKDLLRKLISRLQLNVQYNQKGFVKTGQFYKNIPVSLELQQPDSIKSTFSGEVAIVNNAIQYNGKLFPADSFVESEMGKVRWHINKEYKSGMENKWFVTVQPVASTVSKVKSSLSIQPISKQSSILELTYFDVIPERGEIILNNLVNLYGTTSVDYKSRISANTLNFLDERLRLVSEELSGVEKNLQDFKTTQGIVDLSAEGTLFLGQIKEADNKIAELDVQMDVLDKIENYVTRRNNSNSSIPATLGTSDPILTNLLNQLYQAEFELEKTKQTSGSKNPQIEVYEEAIRKLKPSIISSISNLKMGIETGRKRVRADNSKLTSTVNKIPVKERLLLDISRQQGIKNAIYTFLLQKREEAAISAAAILPNYRVIEKPESAGMVSPVPTKIYSLGIIISLILAILFVYFKEFLNSRLLFRNQIEERVNIPVIAELSLQPLESGNPVVVSMDNRSLIGEQIRELRTNLTYITSVTNEKSKVILITSSIPGEGKSFVAINTSVSLCLAGSKVVLLEFDLRKPKISKELGILREPGLSNYLINRATESEIIKKHPTIANFSIIPSGPIPPNPAELISGQRLGELMDYLKEHFDYIIMDSPPVSAVTDAKILAAFAHTTLYIVRYDYTKSNFLELIKDINQKSILPSMNIVFNGIKLNKILGYSYGQSYGYGYGYGYGYTEDSPKKTKGNK